MTLSSDVQPIGKFRKYRKTICTMNATNITASRPAATFSARRRSHAPTLPGDAFMGRKLFQRVDFLEHALGPVLRLVRGKIGLLREIAKRLDVRSVDIEALLPEGVGQFRFALQVLVRAPGDRLVGRR